MSARLRSWWATAPLDRLEGVMRRAYRRWPGDVIWAVSALGSLALALPGDPRYTLPAIVFGALGGLRAGKPWRDRLREQRDEAAALIAQWNASEARDALAEAVPPERLDRSGLVCARCGSDTEWLPCEVCDGWGWTDQMRAGGEVEEVDCFACDGKGGWPVCVTSEDWCQANPLPGRGDVARGNIERPGQASAEPPYRPETEVPLCAWCPDPTPADCRVDLPDVDAANVPACYTHRDLARIGDVDLSTAVVDEHTYLGAAARRVV